MAMVSDHIVGSMIPCIYFIQLPWYYRTPNNVIRLLLKAKIQCLCNVWTLKHIKTVGLFLFSKVLLFIKKK